MMPTFYLQIATCTALAFSRDASSNQYLWGKHNTLPHVPTVAPALWSLEQSARPFVGFDAAKID
jgi:hypothetical protein